IGVRVDYRRRNVVVPAAPIIPRKKNCCVRPIGAIANRIDDRSDPRWPRAIVLLRMIGSLGGWYYPTHRWQLAVRNVGQYLRLILGHGFFRIRVGVERSGRVRYAHVFDRIGAVPDDSR